MWLIGVRNLLAQRGRLVLTFITVVLGVAFASGTLFFADSIGAGARAIRTDVAVLVAPSPGGEEVEYDARPTLLPAAQLPRLAAIPGVAATDGIVDGYAAVVGQDGKVVRPAGFANDLIGTNWSETPRLRLVEGRAPAGPGEIAVEQVAARNGELTPGTRTTALHGSGAEEVTVVGIYLYQPALRDGPGRAPALAFDTTTAQRVLQQPNTFTSVELTAAPGVSTRQLRDAVAATLPAGLVAHDGALLAEQSRQQEESDAGTTAQILLSFTLVALLIGATLIANTFAMLVGRRAREFGMLRAIGATRRQITMLVLVEAAGIGVLATAVGMLVGVGLALPMIDFAAGRDPVLGNTLHVTPRAVLSSLAVGVLVTVLAAWLPARRAAAVPPVTALHGDIVLVPKAMRVRTILGLGLASIGTLFCLLGLLGNRPPFTVAGVVGAFTMLIAVVLLAAGLARVILRLVAAPIRHRLLPRLAVENVMRNPRRTAATVSALMVGVALATGIAVFAASATEADRTVVERTVRAPFLAANIGGGQISEATLARVRAVAGVTSAAPIRRETAGTGEEGFPLTAVNPAALGSLLDLELATGTPDGLATGALAHESLAAERDWSVGDSVDLTLNGQRVKVAITGLYADAALLGDGLLVSDDFAERHFRPGNGDTVVIGADDNGSELRSGLEAALADRPDVRLYTPAQYAAEEAGAFAILIRIATTLLALALVIAVLGIINTLALSVLERTGEVGLLRAIGMHRRQVRAMITVESMLIATVGGVLGITVGILLGAMVQHAVLARPVTDAAIPLSLAVGAFAAMGVAGVVAAQWPARRAARTDVLEAMRAE
ncbi:FtsX-like permease family protein [Plantactinospora sp. ZYX-F-223]|uniref:ABC transporter permease n=1 Tax=Plantactinospora sp. ZYX-F-223 TaxID=3144103 RepID=UPI0031FCE2C9